MLYLSRLGRKIATATYKAPQKKRLPENEPSPTKDIAKIRDHHRETKETRRDAPQSKKPEKFKPNKPSPSKITVALDARELCIEATSLGDGMPIQPSRDMVGGNVKPADIYLGSILPTQASDGSVVGGLGYVTAQAFEGSVVGGLGYVTPQAFEGSVVEDIKREKNPVQLQNPVQLNRTERVLLSNFGQSIWDYIDAAVLIQEPAEATHSALALLAEASKAPVAPPERTVPPGDVNCFLACWDLAKIVNGSKAIEPELVYPEGEPVLRAAINAGVSEEFTSDLEDALFEKDGKHATKALGKIMQELAGRPDVVAAWTAFKDAVSTDAPATDAPATKSKHQMPIKRPWTASIFARKEAKLAKQEATEFATHTLDKLARRRNEATSDSDFGSSSLIVSDPSSLSLTDPKSLIVSDSLTISKPKSSFIVSDSTSFTISDFIFSDPSSLISDSTHGTDAKSDVSEVSDVSDEAGSESHREV